MEIHLRLNGGGYSRFMGQTESVLGEAGAIHGFKSYMGKFLPETRYSNKPMYATKLVKPVGGRYRAATQAKAQFCSAP